MISELKFAFGANSSAVALAFAPGPVTVFVGPNNSGKSVVLREIGSGLFHSIYQHMITWQPYVPPDRRRIIREVTAPSEDWARLREYFRKADALGTTYVGSLVEDHPNPGFVNSEQFIREIDQTRRQDLIEQARLRVRRAQVELLDGQRRLGLIDQRPLGNLKQAPVNHLQALFRDDGKRRRLAEMTKDAFGMYFVIDPTSGGNLQVAFSEILPDSIEKERSLSEEAIQFFGAAIPAADVSDGVKAYTGILAAVLAADLKVLLIDEPDAFLHPPLARRLGAALTALACEREGNVFASTHDSNFLMGCIQVGKTVNVVRLTYERSVATARLLEASRLRTMMRDPLLRSTRVLDALFHRGAVVCEADADRVFYREINDRQAAMGKRAAVDCVFLNAQNKQTVRRIIQPLREMGIPAAAVIDLDVIRKGNNDLRDLMQASSVPDALVKAWGQLRGEVESAFEQRGLVAKREGIGALSGAEKEAAEALINSLREYGIFVTPVGELERWLEFLGVPSSNGEQKRDWVPSIFDRMGNDPDAPGYVHPSDGDVWSFVEQIAAWIANPSRKGMP